MARNSPGSGHRIGTARSAAKPTTHSPGAATPVGLGRTVKLPKVVQDRLLPTFATSSGTPRKSEPGERPATPVHGTPIFAPFNELSRPLTPHSPAKEETRLVSATEAVSHPPSVSATPATDSSSPTPGTAVAAAGLGSTERSWRPPSTVREFAAQTNSVATLVLRGEIDLERARVYSGLARTVAQAMSTEVSRARFLAQEPDLSLEEAP